MPTHDSPKDAAMAFLKHVAEGEHLSAEVQKGDVEHTVKVAREAGYTFETKDMWDAITELQRNPKQLTRNVPSWIIDRLRVAVHD
jgi:hypothetical protein